MKKRLICMTLALSLCLSPALAAGTGEKFPAVNQFPGYSDVRETDWFYDNAKLCYEIGLITGTDVGFEPHRTLSEAEAVTLAARVGAALRGDVIPPAQPGDAWWEPYNSYVFSHGGIENPDLAAGRWQFLSMLYGYVEDLLTPINEVTQLPDPDFRDDVMVLQYYNAGILTGMDKYGTFEGDKSLTRAEAAAMLSRIVRPELRKHFVPVDYSPFTAAYLTPETVMFDNGVTAEQFLTAVNNELALVEKDFTAKGVDFNWHYLWTDTSTTLDRVTAAALEACGATADRGTQAYKDLDIQVYYSRLIDLMDQTL